MDATPRVLCTAAAARLVQQLRGRYGELLFHQSGGCCDGSAPMCYPRGEFLLGAQDVCLGEIEGVPFCMSRSQFEYWQHTQLIIDVVDGQGGMFSLENGTGQRFLTRSRLYSDEEAARLAPVQPAA